MNKGKIFFISIYSVLALFLNSCDYYLGMNQQPDFDDENIDEGLNIFGLLRPDSLQNFNRSFVFVQQIWPALGYETFAIIHNVQVAVEEVEDSILSEVTEFPMLPADSLFADTLYRPVEHFSPQAGKRYRLTCRCEGFPDAIGETVVPAIPEIIDGSLNTDDRNVSFILAADTLIKMLDIYIVGDNYSQFIARIVPDDGADTEIVLELPVDPEGLVLKLFSYDTHLAAYYGNANTSLNFNKYRTTITTLESGFGVFGSLNYTTISLNSEEH